MSRTKPLSKRELEKRAEKAWSLLNPCHVCPRKCGVNRKLKTKDLPRRQAGLKLKTSNFGFCQMGVKPRISSSHPHFGEEAPLVGPSTGSGQGGSGTIFFSSCNLACVYCQNYEISQLRLGEEVEIKDLALMMLSLQKRGCHNINFVSPTIWAPQILKALVVAREKGLKIPLVYNTGGYDSVKTLKILDGIIDIYMPDMKYSDSKNAKKYSLVDNYWEINKKAVKEMFQQVEDLVIDEKGIASRGLLIRHLVLPNDLSGTKKVMKFIASLSKNSYVNIMDQYRPCHKARKFPELSRNITSEEFSQATEVAKNEGLHRFDKREPRYFLKFL